jgi:hypothetical protein
MKFASKEESNEIDLDKHVDEIPNFTKEKSKSISSRYSTMGFKICDDGRDLFLDTFVFFIHIRFI